MKHEKVDSEFGAKRKILHAPSPPPLELGLYMSLTIPFSNKVKKIYEKKMSFFGGGGSLRNLFFNVAMHGYTDNLLICGNNPY